MIKANPAAADQVVSGKESDPVERKATQNGNVSFSVSMEDHRPSDPAPENLETPSEGERRSIRERLELLEIFGESALEPLLPGAATEEDAARAADKANQSKPKPPKKVA